MNVKELFHRAIQIATAEVGKISLEEDLGKPTPNTKWTVKDLLNHTLSELLWTANIVAGKTIDEVGSAHDGNLVNSNLSVAWREAADKALAAVSQADLQDTAHLSYGDVRVEAYLQEAATDQLIHAWDLSTALGKPLYFDPALAEAVRLMMLPKLDGMKQSGMFAEPLEVTDSADSQTKLLAFFGRDISWLPSQST